MILPADPESRRAVTETTRSAVISVMVVDSGEKVKDLLQTELSMGRGGRMGQVPI